MLEEVVALKSLCKLSKYGTSNHLFILVILIIFNIIGYIDAGKNGLTGGSHWSKVGGVE
jgi:hypothetical protein